MSEGKGDCMAEACWYVVHTYSGYENKVKANIEKTIENRHLEDQILEVRVPLQDVVEVKNGVKKTVQKKMFPGYVLLNMIMNDDTWYVVRNTRGVTGFVGPGSKPVPLTDDRDVQPGYPGRQHFRRVCRGRYGHGDQRRMERYRRCDPVYQREQADRYNQCRAVRS